MIDLATRCRRAQWAWLGAAFLLSACGGGATLKDQGSVSAPATAPAPSASSPAVAPAPAPTASAPTPAPPPVSLPPIPGAVGIPGVGTGLNTTTLATGSGTVFTAALTAQQTLEIASSAYRATKVLDQQIRFVTRVGSNLVTRFSALNLPSYRDDKVACSKAGTSTSSWVKSSGDTASLGWAQGDVLTMIFDECRYDDGGRFHGYLRITAQRNMVNVRDGVGMQFAMQFVDLATPLDGVSTALGTGALSVAALTSATGGILANYAGSAGYVMNVVDGFGMVTNRMDALADFNGGTSADDAREARQFAGHLRIRRTGSAGFAADGQAVIQISPALERLIGSTDWQRESGKGAVTVRSIPGAGNGLVLLSANADVATVSVDHQADAVVDMYTTTTMTLIGTGVVQASNASTVVLQPPPASVGTTTLPAAGTSSTSIGVTPGTPGGTAGSGTFTNSLVVSTDAALSYARQSVALARVFDPQARAVLEAANQMVASMIGTETGSFENSVSKCGVTGQFVLSVSKAAPGVTRGFQGRNDNITIAYQNCSWWEDQTWTGTVTVQIESPVSTTTPGSSFTARVYVDNLSMPGVGASGGRATVSATFDSRYTFSANARSMEMSYGLRQGSVAIGGTVFEGAQFYGPNSLEFKRVSADSNANAPDNVNTTTEALKISGPFRMITGSGEAVSARVALDYSQTTASGRQFATETPPKWLIDLGFTRVSTSSQPYDDKLRVSTSRDSVAITVDRNGDGVNDLSLDTTLADLGS